MGRWGSRVLLAGLVAGSLTLPARAAEATVHELPFTCAQDWTASTRPRHSPSANALDLNRSADLGQLVVASAPGRVSRVEDTGARSYGRWVQVEHADGSATLYAHLLAQWVVPGQMVDQGTPLGRVGASGGVSGPHLHYEQRVGRAVQPVLLGGIPVVLGRPLWSRNCADVPLAGDWDGDRVAEVAVFRRDAGLGRFEFAPDADDGAGAAAVPFGRATDLPVVGDWDGDGRTDVGVRRQQTRTFLLRSADGTFTRHRLGLIRDVPVTGDWDGDGATEVGIWRPRAARFRLLRSDGTQQVVRLGDASSQPVTGDWDGDGVTDLGVFDAARATFRLRTLSAEGVASVVEVPLGSSTDLPVTGDWDGNGVTDLGTWTPANATYTLRAAPQYAGRRSARVQLRTIVFGRPR